MIRELYAQTAMAKTYGYGPGRFSFNVSAKQGGGRCEACEGAGVREVEMHFLPNVFVQCEVCRGKRYNARRSRDRYQGQVHLADVLAMTDRRGARACSRTTVSQEAARCRRWSTMASAT